MAYATQSDIEELYGENALYVADRDGDGVADAAAVAKALSDASDLIDSYLAVRYAVPLFETPSVVRQLCVDLGLYRLALTEDVLTEELKERNKAALDMLDRLSSGKQRLVFPSDGTRDDDGDGEVDDNSPRPIVQAGPEREFTRDKMSGL